MKNAKNAFSCVEPRKYLALRRKFDLSMLLLAMVVLLAGIWCFGRDYNLLDKTFHGFALWFLLFISYPLLLLWSLINTCLRIDTSFVAGRENLILAVSGELTVIIVWAACRLWAWRSKNSSALPIATNFVRIFIGWGAIQLLIGGLMLLWNSGGLSPSLHKHLYAEPEAERVTIVSQPAKK